MPCLSQSMAGWTFSTRFMPLNGIHQPRPTKLAQSLRDPPVSGVMQTPTVSLASQLPNTLAMVAKFAVNTTVPVASVRKRRLQLLRLVQSKRDLLASGAMLIPTALLDSPTPHTPVTVARSAVSTTAPVASARNSSSDIATSP